MVSHSAAKIAKTLISDAFASLRENTADALGH
jgi:hypothetical protein